MADAPLLFPERRRRPPLAAAFFAPVDLSDASLIRALTAVSLDLLSTSTTTLPFQRRNTRSLLRKLRTFLSLFHSLLSSPSPLRLSTSASLSFKELYILLHRSKSLLDYCSSSSRLFLLLRNPQISNNFHDLTLEFSTLLDVFPLDDLNLPDDLQDQVDLLREQSRRSVLYIDPGDEELRLQIYAFLESFENGTEPDQNELERVFVEGLGIRNARICRTEIEFLEEQIYNRDEELDAAVLDAVAALARYCRLLLFTAEAEYRKFFSFGSSKGGRSMKGKALRDTGESESFVSIPKDFCCTISLELMTDPVVVSTGQTYDRDSIVRWMEEGHNTCPNSGQSLTHKKLIPNRALRNMISQWCAANSVPYDPPEAAESVAFTSSSKAAVEANKFSTQLLIQLLSVGSDDAKAVAARELRLLAKTARLSRAYIAEAGAIPLLQRLLASDNPIAQENSVTALLNLSIHDKNKSRIMEEGCLRSIVDVLINGLTTEARENAAATLFSLSAVHDYKKQIADEEGAAKALADLLRNGTPRGKKDAVTALFNLSTHSGNCKEMVESGAALALVDALEMDSVAEEAAGALALLVRQKVTAEAVVSDNTAIAGLVGLMRRGTPKAKENAVAALVEMCRNGGAKVTEKVAVVPAIAGLIQTLLFTGSKRARRKAASLARLFQRHEASGAMPNRGWSREFSIPRSRSRRMQVPNRDNNNGEPSDVTVSVSISVL